MSGPELCAALEAREAITLERALAATIEREYPSLSKTVQLYVWRAGLATRREDVIEVAAEVLAEATARALARAARWEPSRGTRPWIAKFAANVILERQRLAGAEARHRARPTASPLMNDRDDTMGPESLPDPSTLGSDRLFELLELVPEPDRTLLRLAFVEDLARAALATRLNVSEGAVRVRITRAKDRFAQAYAAAERGEKGGRR